MESNMGLLEFLVEAGGLSVVAVLLIIVLVRQNTSQAAIIKELHDRLATMNETLVTRLHETALPQKPKE